VLDWKNKCHLYYNFDSLVDHTYVVSMLGLCLSQHGLPVIHTQGIYHTAWLVLNMHSHPLSRLPPPMPNMWKHSLDYSRLTALQFQRTSTAVACPAASNLESAKTNFHISSFFKFTFTSVVKYDVDLDMSPTYFLIWLHFRKSFGMSVIFYNSLIIK